MPWNPFNIKKGGKQPAWWFTGYYKNPKKTPAFEFQPYGGLRPPRVDYTDSNGQAVDILRPTQKMIFDTLMRRSQGQDVGYDPARKTAALALLTSQLGKQKEDDIRTAQGRISSAGLSGNPRAVEALTGRVNRDYGRTLGEEVNKLNIEDLTRANEERDTNTERLRALNQFNFGQDNRVADFALDVYSAEQGNRRASAASALEGYQYDTGRDDASREDLMNLGLQAADIYLMSQGAPPGTASTAASALSGGKGIASPYDFSDVLTVSGGRTGFRKPFRTLVR